MAEAIMMPRQGLSVESCILTEWHKEVGDEIKKGDVIFSFETDKSSFEKEAEVEGVLLAKFFERGDEVPVLTNIGAVGESGEDVEDLRPEDDSEEEIVEVEEETEEKTDEVQSEFAQEVTTAEITEASEEDIIKVSPRARKLAEKQNVVYEMAEPTGPEGRIIERDIQKLIAEGPVFTPAALEVYHNMETKPAGERLQGTGPGGKITVDDLKKGKAELGQKRVIGDEIPERLDYKEEEMSNIRKNIAQTMHQSLQSTAQLTLNTSFDASEILAYRQKIKVKKDELGLANITLNAIILYTVARTLQSHEALNAHLVDEKLRLFTDVHLGVAVDTDRGLMVPTIFQANLKSLEALAGELTNRAEECREGNINPDYLSGASFTVTNLGTQGIESFTPVINPPQTGILGLNTIEYKIRKNEQGEFEEYPAMGLSLTFDHRALDGAPAARFLKELSLNLENFELLLAK